jgi:hypothetical protein
LAALIVSFIGNGKRGIEKRWAETGVWSAAPPDQDLRAPGGSLHIETETVAKLVRADLFQGGRRVCLVESGAEGIRTPGLRHAMAALCQLSYSPEAILVGPV